MNCHILTRQFIPRKDVTVILAEVFKTKSRLMIFM